MTVRITRIGNSRGIRIPKNVLDLYRLREGDELTLDYGPQGITLKPAGGSSGKLSFAAAYREMALEVAESGWDRWNATSSEEPYDH